jgi:hypothetical protein
MPWHGEVSPSDVSQIKSFDIAIVACGYESRCLAVSQTHASSIRQGFALCFPSQRDLAFDSNRASFQRLRFDILEVTDEAVEQTVLALLSRVGRDSSGSELRVLIDVSSQSRARMAAIVSACQRVQAITALEAYFFYSLAIYDGPSVDQMPNVAIGPVSARFAGWSQRPELPVSLVLGLGYEPDRALGAFEALEPTSVWALVPNSAIAGYHPAVLKSNKSLLERIPSNSILGYRVEDPNSTFALIASLTRRLKVTSTVVLLPSGPKLLALLTLLLASEDREIAVWRVSAGPMEAAVNRRTTGTEICVRYDFVGS